MEETKLSTEEKKKKTDAAWKKKNKITLGCVVYRADAEAFREYAAAQGKSVNELLRGYVSACLGRPLERRDGGTAGDDPKEK